LHLSNEEPRDRAASVATVGAVTPHEQRKRELGVLRQVIADCKPYSGAATVPNSTVASIFDRHTSRLPETSKLRGQLERLAARLRQDPEDVVVGSRLRQIVVGFQQKADKLGAFVEARDARLGGRT
jgi:hypothetical protein